MIKSLTELFHQIQDNDDKEAILEILNRFEPLIKKYIRKLGYMESYSHFAIILLCIICQEKIPFQKDNEGKIINYLVQSIYHEYIRLSKKTLAYKNAEILSSDLNSNTYSVVDKQFISLEMKDALNHLISQQQKKVIFLHYYQGYSIQEITNFLHISRQSVNMTKNRALISLKKILTE